MPTFPYWAVRFVLSHDLIHLHVPQLDAAPLAILGRILRKPVVLTYHCDLRLPGSPLNWIANGVSGIANRVSAAAASVVVANTRDYAEESPLLSRHLNKLVIIPPPNEVAHVRPATTQSILNRAGIQPGQRLIGMAGRLATEKGAEYLALSLAKVLESYPEARVLHMGQYKDVMGEEAYFRRLEPIFDQLGGHWTFLGVLSAEEKAAFFSICDVTVLPSLNSTESFGMVQVESMMCGTPVVASDLPGVRQPTRTTGMGLTVPPRDPSALADAIIKILDNPQVYISDPYEVSKHYATERVALRYESLFETLVTKKERIETV